MAVGRKTNADVELLFTEKPFYGFGVKSEETVKSHFLVRFRRQESKPFCHSKLEIPDLKLTLVGLNTRLGSPNRHNKPYG